MVILKRRATPKIFIMKNLKLFFTISLGLLLFGCKNENIVEPPPNMFEIGDTYEGGIIFNLDQTGGHGKICSAEDLGTFDWNGAKVACENYYGEGYSDWYLPSRWDLDMIAANNIGDLAGIYWSSNGDSTLAVNYNSDIKSNFVVSTDIEFNVRAIRDF